ncbi:unnamed protein product, partial [Rotaria sordida]
NTNIGSLEEYEIGIYRELKARSRSGDGLDIHHLIQKQIGNTCIPGYSLNNGICIAFRASDHRQIPTLRSDEITSRYVEKHSRQILADNILRDRSVNVIPVRVLLEALHLHVHHYPNVCERLSDTQTQVESRSESLIIILEDEARKSRELEEKGRWALTKGNRLSRLLEKVRKYLQNATTSLNYTTTGKDHDDNEANSHSFVIHEEYDQRLGRNLIYSVRCEFIREETRTE